MTTSANSPAHPGRYVRENIIPTGMSVTDAAKRLRLGRPALSNFLNGKSALSPEMAVRLAKAFGADRERLLEMQAVFDRHELRASEKEIAVRAFVPEFLTIKARQIENWADRQIEARTHLAVLLRKLVHSTGDGLQRVDLPGYDNAERKGSDGFVEAGAATPWVPEGRSFWELGTGQNPAQKAESDYIDRLTTVNAAERRESTFIFVTPRSWPGKADWEQQKSATGDWKAVRAFDASDLEQWLEQSVPAQMWFAEQIGIPADGYQTLENAWHRWASVCKPLLTPEIFAPSVAAALPTLRRWLEDGRPGALVVTADSRAEALAFLKCLLDHKEVEHLRDRVAIFTSAASLQRLLPSTTAFFPILDSQTIERELAGDLGQRSYLVFRPRNATAEPADLSVALPDHHSFVEALGTLGFDRDEGRRLARESGRSPTVLRRRLAHVPALRTPPWAEDDRTADEFSPVAWAGAWNAHKKADQEILSFLGDRPYEKVEGTVSRLLRQDDTPVWSAGTHRGVVSKVDALFGIATRMDSTHIERFFEAAEYVLSEIDPSLELPEEERWLAALHGKERDHSRALRDGVCETLVILSIHGNTLFRSLGVDIEGRVAHLIRELLTPLTLERLLSQDLPRLAEAAPDVFLDILEEDLRQSEPVLLDLLQPVSRDSLFTSPRQSGLLWALEGLAWAPQTFPRTALILARLSQKEIDDNWANKPIESLRSIFRSWWPQTAASVEERVEVLRTISERFPEIGWRIAVEQVRPVARSGSASDKPRWRRDALNSGAVASPAEKRQFEGAALTLLFEWPGYDEKKLGDLVECCQEMAEGDLKRLWHLVDQWNREAGDIERAELRERLQGFAAGPRVQELGEDLIGQVRGVWSRLEPSDMVLRDRWLFASDWLHDLPFEADEEPFDFERHRQHVEDLRRQAFDRIWSEREFNGVQDLLPSGAATDLVGRCVAVHLLDLEAQSDFVRRCLSLGHELRQEADSCLRGFLAGLAEDRRVEVLKQVGSNLRPEERIRLLLLAPFQASTWRLLDQADDESREDYWRKIHPVWRQHQPDETSELIHRLLAAKRPLAAFHALHLDFGDVATEELKAMLEAIAFVEPEEIEPYRINPSSLARAFETLNRRHVGSEVMSRLELLFAEGLQDTRYGTPNLEEELAKTPALFAELVTWVYRRRDADEHAPEWAIDDPDRREALGRKAYGILSRMATLPGASADGSIDDEKLKEWLKEVRRLCREAGRAEAGDSSLGAVLAKAPADADDVWPCEAVSRAMEEVASAELRDGFVVAVRNSRGAQWGGGGDREHEVAAKYRGWAERRRYRFPFVGSVLEEIARSYDQEAKWWDARNALRDRVEV